MSCTHGLLRTFLDFNPLDQLANLSRPNISYVHEFWRQISDPNFYKIENRPLPLAGNGLSEVELRSRSPPLNLNISAPVCAIL